MSVTLAQVLSLPCLKDARVVAGHHVLDRTVTSVSVLEYASPTALLDEFFEKNRFIGSEIALTCWYNIKDDVDAQCNVLKHLADYGEVALILYYVGIVMKELDARVVQTAQDQGIALVVMPEGHLNYRYSEVITAVMEVIIKDRTEQTHFSSDILTQVTRLPAHLRTMDTLLSMLRDRLHASFLLTDQNGKPLNCVAYPQSAANTLVLAAEAQQYPRPWWRHQSRISTGKGPAMYMQIIGVEGQAMNEDAVRQVVEVVQLFVNIWSPNHNQFISAEMIRTILRDEPIKMRRLGELFHIDVAALQEMWVVLPTQRCSVDRDTLRSRFTNTLKEEYKISICDTFEDAVVGITDGMCSGNRESIGTKYHQCSCEVYSIQNMHTTTEVREAYLRIQETREACRVVFPQKALYTAQDTQFVAECLACIDAGQQSIDERTACLRPIAQEPEMLRTLASLLLDCQSSVAHAAASLNLHVNTIKYRVGKLTGAFGSPVVEFPLNSLLAFALAIERILKDL
jgi:DNA-binding PucR family transcriptional regulator